MYKKILSLIKKNKNVFITGSAGTGKSFILNKLREDLNDLCVTASTGVAAINVNGSTIHSFAGIGLGIKTAKQIAHSMHKKTKLRIQYCNRLAIDEISMLSADIFDLINNVFKIIKDSDLPFGGIQLIVIGDFLQLPPVSKGNKETIFAFESVSWKETKFINILLDKQYRQDDLDFLSDLNKIRMGENVTIQNNIEDSNEHTNALHLFPLNLPADQYNKYKLNEVEGQIYTFLAVDTGNLWAIEKINKDCLVPKNLFLKIGARVMLLINKYIDLGLINGSLGKISNIYGSTITVKFDNDVTIDLSYENVAKIVEKRLDIEVELASRSQIPLRLAYAISIHKAQGLTLNNVVVDFKGAFECGQAYVALSRVRSRESLSVKNLRQDMIRANKKAVAFYKELQE